MCYQYFLYVLGNEWRKPKLMVDNHLKITTYNHSSSFYKLMSRFSLLLLPFLKKAYTILSPTGLREISGIARKSVLKRKPLPSLSRSQNLSKRRKASFSENPVSCRITLKSSEEILHCKEDFWDPMPKKWVGQLGGALGMLDGN